MEPACIEYYENRIVKTWHCGDSYRVYQEVVDINRRGIFSHSEWNVVTTSRDEFVTFIASIENHSSSKKLYFETVLKRIQTSNQSGKPEIVIETALTFADNENENP
jgi:hypothetical protein